jgi:hypothetical protein
MEQALCPTLFRVFAASDPVSLAFDAEAKLDLWLLTACPYSEPTFVMVRQRVFLWEAAELEGSGWWTPHFAELMHWLPNI